MLVPTVRHGDQLRRRLVVRCGAALRLRVETIPQFSRQLAGDTRIPSRMLAGELLAQTARREVERGPAAYFRPIAGTSGFIDLLNAAVDDLLAEAVDPRAFSESAARTGSPSVTALAAVYAAYSAELERRDWRHPAQIALAAADSLRVGAAVPPVVMLDGFHLFRGSELALLQVLSDRSEVAAALGPRRRRPRPARFPTPGTHLSRYRDDRPLRAPAAARGRAVFSLSHFRNLFPCDRDRGRGGGPRSADAGHSQADQAAPDRRAVPPPLRLRCRLPAGVALSQPGPPSLRRV